MIFTAHKIQLDDGTWTESPYKDSGEGARRMQSMAWLPSTLKLLNIVFPGDKSKLRIADLGCLEGGYTTAFARMGFDTLGVDARSSNIECCEYVKSKVNLPNLNFVQDDVRNIKKYGKFDVSFCCGLIYHLDDPVKFLKQIASQTKKMIILQSHFATDDVGDFPQLSELVKHKGVRGRWIKEFDDNEDQEYRRWSSFKNSKSFWIYKSDLIQLIHDTGFDTVFESYDWCSWDGVSISGYMDRVYDRQLRGMFIGIKS